MIEDRLVLTNRLWFFVSFSIRRPVYYIVSIKSSKRSLKKVGELHLISCWFDVRLRIRVKTFLSFLVVGRLFYLNSYRIQKWKQLLSSFAYRSWSFMEKIVTATCDTVARHYSQSGDMVHRSLLPQMVKEIAMYSINSSNALVVTMERSLSSKIVIDVSMEGVVEMTIVLKIMNRTNLFSFVLNK